MPVGRQASGLLFNWFKIQIIGLWGIQLDETLQQPLDIAVLILALLAVDSGHTDHHVCRETQRKRFWRIAQVATSFGDVHREEFLPMQLSGTGFWANSSSQP